MPSTSSVPAAPPRRRDDVGRIDAAIAAVAGTGGPVTVAAGSAEHVLRFRHAEERPAASGPGWVTFRGDFGELHADGAALLVGLGPQQDDPADALETARHAGATAGARLGGFDVEIDAPAALLPAVVDGLATGYAGTDPVGLFVAAELVEPAQQALLAAEATRLASLLVNAPANVLTPERAAAWAADIAAAASLTCQVWTPDELVDEGFGALMAIGQGSQNGPRLVRLEYSVAPEAPTIALVGKGITFDSGGLSLKSPTAMQSMRLDVAGAATILSVMAAVRRAGCPVNVTAILPFAENLPGPGAARPGDVVTARNGTQVQILDTDFEGRVVLADGLALAAEAGPDLIVDLATLTYQAEIALGPQIAAVLGRGDRAVARMLAAAAAVGEPMWQLPLARRYLDQVRIPYGVRNHPLHDSGRAITAALFLSEFVPFHVPWVHCDMTGPAWVGTASDDGATGFGTRTVLQLLMEAPQ
jgi:leucyl aminopeptidase